MNMGPAPTSLPTSLPTPPPSGSGNVEQAADDVMRLVRAAEPSDVVIGAVARGLARVAGADAAWLLSVGPGATTSRLAAWDPEGLTGVPAVRDALVRLSSSLLDGADQARADGEGEPALAVGVGVDAEGVRFAGCVAAGPSGRLPDDARATMTIYLSLVRSAVATARMARDAQHLGEGQAALRRIAAVAAAGGPSETVFGTVTAEASALLGGALVALARFRKSSSEAVVVAQTGGHVAVGVQLPVTGDTTLARLRASGRAERMDGYAGGSGTEMVEQHGVRAAVSVPVTVDGALWGALGVVSLTGPLPAGTEDRLAVFAEIVAAAAAGADARESARVLADEQAALLRVAALVAKGAGEAEIFDAVAVEAAGLIHDEPTTLVRYDGDRTFTVLATRNGPAPVGTRFTVPVDDAGTLDELLRTGKPARQDQYERIAERSFSKREFGVGSSVSVPIVVNGRLWGSLGTLNEGRRLPMETEGRLAKFAELVASALANVQARAELKRFGDEQAALRRVAELVASAAPQPVVLRAVVAEASLLFDDAEVSLVTPGPAVEDAVARQVLSTGRTARIDRRSAPGAAPPDDGVASAVGTPVRVEGRTWAVLVAVVRDRQLPPETENRLAQFAEIAATAVTSDQARSALRRMANQQAALRRVAELVARGAALAEVFDSVATEASRILDAAANLVRYDDDVATVVAAAHSSVPVGLRMLIDDATAGGNLGAPVAVPVTVEGRVWGALSTTTSGDSPQAETENRLAEFAELAAAAIASAENRAKLRASRARVVATADETRQRLQRDVHDGAQQRLVQTVLTLKLGLVAASRGEETVELMREALEHAERATVELRDIVHGILPASLSRLGLPAGLDSLVAALPLPVDLHLGAQPLERLPSGVEVTAYFVVAEALTNVVKHAWATRAQVTLAAEAGLLVIEVRDDGVGGADPRGGSGLTGLSDRVDALNGALRLTSTAGRGTTLRVILPLSGSPPSSASA